MNCKRWVVPALTLVMSLVARGQGGGEWFNQKQTQTKYLVQQVAALQVYLQYLQQGYKVAKRGLGIIADIKQGHFNLDNAFFSKLKKINPNVCRYGRVADIITLNIRIARQCNHSWKAAQSSGGFSKGQLSYTGTVFNAMADGCCQLINELTDLLSTGKLALSDDERIKRIDGIYAEMEGRYGFIQRFCGDMERMAQQSGRELIEGAHLEALYRK